MPRHFQKPNTRWGAVVFSGVLLAGCGSEGQTPDCGSEFPGTYDIRVPSRRAEVWQTLSVPAGAPYYCATLPAGFEPQVSGQGGAAGEGGATGEEPTDAGAAGATL